MSNPESNELLNGQVKSIDISNPDKNETKMHTSSSQTKQDPIDKSLTSPQENNNLEQNHENKLQKSTENLEQISQKDQVDTSSPSKEELQVSNSDAINHSDSDGSKSGRNYSGHSKKQTGSRDYHSSWKSRNSIPQAKQSKTKRKDDVKPEPLQDLNSWPTLEQARTNDPNSKKTNESTTPKSPKAAPFTQSGDEKQDEPENQNPKKKAINWVPFKEALGPSGSSVSASSTSPPSTAPISAQTSGNPREGRSASNNPSIRGPRGAPRRKDNSDDFYSRPPRDRDSQPREGQQAATGGNSQGRNWRGSQYRRNRGYSNRPFNNNSSGPYQYLYTLEGEQLREAIVYQIEYYFTVENLVRDVWLRSQWDEEGWLPLSVLASFPRVKALTSDVPVLAEALKSSTILECKDEKIRKLEDWKLWILPKSGVATSESPIPSPKSNEQNAPITTESIENSETSSLAPNASQNQPTTRTYASLASADSLKQKQANSKTQQRKPEAPKKTPATSSSQVASISQKPKIEQVKNDPKIEAKKIDSPVSTTSEPKKENTTEKQPTTEEGEWQTVEAKKTTEFAKSDSWKRFKGPTKKI